MSRVLSFECKRLDLLGEAVEALSRGGSVCGKATPARHSASGTRRIRIDWDALCREVQLRLPATLILYEAKSFRGRITVRISNRRTQVERSLARAATLKPDEWNLVVAIDHTPGEPKWFDTLRRRYPFVRSWHGQIDSQLAQFPDLVRFTWPVRQEPLERASQYKQEKEILANGVVDLVERYRSLDALADEISPHYRPVADHTSSGGLRIALQAKHPHAADQAPIVHKFDVTIPHGD